jgi:hypothetical protein
MQTPKEFLCTRVLQKSVFERDRYIKYAQAYKGMKFETKHEVGALIANLRTLHERTSRVDWRNMISEIGSKFIAYCLSDNYESVECAEYGDAAMDMLLAFGGFDSPCDELVEHVEDLICAVSNKITVTRESEYCDMLRPETVALKKYVQLQKNAVKNARDINWQKLPLEKLEIPCGELAEHAEDLICATVQDNDAMKNAQDTGWQKLPLEKLERRLAKTRFPVSGNVDFQKYFTLSLKIPKTRELPSPDLPKNTPKIPLQPVVVVGDEDRGNPYASNGWNANVIVEHSTSPKPFRYPGGIKMTGGNNAMLGAVLYDDDCRFYPMVRRALSTASKRIELQPIVPLSLPPFVESMSSQELTITSNILENAIKTMEEVRAAPWQSISQKRQEEEEARTQKNRDAAETQARQDIRDLEEAGALYVAITEQREKKEKKEKMKCSEKGAL